MFIDGQRIDLLNRLIDAHVDLAAYAQLRKAKGYMSVSEDNHLRDNFFKLNRELHGKSLWLNFHPDQEKWSALHHAEEALATTTVCLMSGRHDCLTVTTVSANRLENCLISLTLSIQDLQKHAMLGEVWELGGRKCFPPHIQVFVKMSLLSPPLTML